MSEPALSDGSVPSLESSIEAERNESSAREDVRRPAKIITLDVGGRLLRTMDSTIPVESALYSFINSDISARTEEGHLFLDRDPDTFQSLLNILRCRRVFSMSLSELRAVFSEADYFMCAEVKQIVESHVYTRFWPESLGILDETFTTTSVHSGSPKRIIFVAADSPLDVSSYEIELRPSSFKMEFPYDEVAQKYPGHTDPNPIFTLNSDFCAIDSLGNPLPGMEPSFDQFKNVKYWKFYGTDIGYARIDMIQYRNIYFLHPTKRGKTHSIKDALFIEHAILSNWDFYWNKTRWYSSQNLTIVRT